MLQVTEQATQHLVQVRGERGLKDDAAARFVPSGAGVGLTFATKPEKGDRVIENSDIAIYVAPQVAEKLDAAVIDVSVKDGRAGLSMRPQGRAKAKAS